MTRGSTSVKRPRVGVTMGTMELVDLRRTSFGANGEMCAERERKRSVWERQWTESKVRREAVMSIK